MANKLKNQNNGKSNIQRLLSESSIYYIGLAIGSFSSFVSLPILTRKLSTGEYGILSLVILTRYLVLVVTKCGLQNSAVYYYNDYKKNEETIFYSTLFYQSISIALVVAGIFCLMFTFGGALFSNLKTTEYAALISIMVVFESVIIRIKNFLRIEQRVIKFVFIGVVRRYLGLSFGIIGLYYASDPIAGFLVGEILFDTILLMIILPAHIKQRKINFKSIDKTLLVNCMKYGWPFIGIEFCVLLMKYSDRYLIDYFMGIEYVGIYSVAGNLSMMAFDQIFAAFFLAISPIYMKIYKSDGEKKTQQFISKAVRYLLIIIFPAVVGFILISNDIVLILASKKFEEAKNIIPFIVIGAALWAITPIYGTGFYVAKKTKLFTKITFGTVIVNIILNIILIPRYGLIGAGISNLLAYTLNFLVVRVVAFKFFSFKTNLKSIVKVLLANMFMIIVLNIIGLEINLINLFLKIIIGAICYATVIYLLEEDVRIHVNKYSLKIWEKKYGFIR